MPVANGRLIGQGWQADSLRLALMLLLLIPPPVNVVRMVCQLASPENQESIGEERTSQEEATLVPDTENLETVPAASRRPARRAALQWADNSSSVRFHSMRRADQQGAGVDTLC